MKALITGGAGFIGSHLAERLIARGDDVAVLDDLSTGSLENLSSLRGHPRLTFVEGDARHIETVRPLVEGADTIFHLAAAVGVQLIVDRPVHTIETNVHGTEVLLHAAHALKRPILLASTSEVYGKSERIPFREDDDTTLGATRFSRWSYACSKAIDEFLGLAYARQYGLPVIVARFFNTVGPRQTGQYGMVIPRFVERALRNEPLLIYGSGRQSRCFGYVGDVVRAVDELMRCETAFGRVYNIGGTEEITIEDLADRIIRLTGSRSEKRFLSYEEAYGCAFDDMMRRMPCLDRIRETIGYEPTATLDAMLEEIIAEKRRQLGSTQA